MVEVRASHALRPALHSEVARLLGATADGAVAVFAGRLGLLVVLDLLLDLEQLVVVELQLFDFAFLDLVLELRQVDEAARPVLHGDSRLSGGGHRLRLGLGLLFPLV